jgi:lipopolysaccharide/colanic/teichoic acid biosynthesis glycosyltransferase
MGVKRAMDVVLATIGMVALAPVLLAVGTVIALSSPGPVIYRSTRVGWGGRTFRMLKFRTMYDGADRDRGRLEAVNEADGLFKMTRDPRTTRVGLFLRHHSLDELPQLVNVLRGEMSLVGPRPLVPEEARLIAPDGAQWLAMPGITGLWQISCASRFSLDELVSLNARYDFDWSLWLDVKILLSTICHAVLGRGL